MSLTGFGKRQVVGCGDLQTTCLDPRRTGQWRAQLFLRLDIVEEHGPAGRKLSVLSRIAQPEIRDHFGELAEVHEHAALVQAFQRFAPGVCTDAVMDDRAKPPPAISFTRSTKSSSR